MGVLRPLAMVLLALALATPAAVGARRGALPRPVRCAALPRAAPLATAGPGWRIPPTWATRGLRWGTPELVGLIKRAARRLARRVPDATLEVGDLSPWCGGPSRWHRTHRHGEDVDLHFFAHDAADRPVPVGRAMVAFDCDGRSAAHDEAGHPIAPRTFDVTHTWALVRALVEDHHAKITDILIAECLRRKLLDHARAVKAPAVTVARAARLMRQPRFAPHNDHLHVKINGNR